MLEFWLLSSGIYFATHIGANSILVEKYMSEGYVTHGKKTSKAKYIRNTALGFIPYLNLGLSLFNIGIIVLSNKIPKKMKNALIKDGTLQLPEDVIYSYERKQLHSENIVDAMTLDGADKETINKELNEISKENGPFLTKEDSKSLFGNNDFSKKEYNLAVAQQAAKEYLSEIQTNIDLSASEKGLLLKSFRKVYLDEHKGIDKPSLKPIEQTNKILSLRK